LARFALYYGQGRGCESNRRLGVIDGNGHICRYRPAGSRGKLGDVRGIWTLKSLRNVHMSRTSPIHPGLTAEGSESIAALSSGRELKDHLKVRESPSTSLDLLPSSATVFPGKVGDVHGIWTLKSLRNVHMSRTSPIHAFRNAIP